MRRRARVRRSVCPCVCWCVRATVHVHAGVCARVLYCVHLLPSLLWIMNRQLRSDLARMQKALSREGSSWLWPRMAASMLRPQGWRQR